MPPSPSMTPCSAGSCAPSWKRFPRAPRQALACGPVASGALSSLSEHGKLKELPRDQREEAKRLVDQLIASFRAHEEQETNEVTALLEKLPPDAYRTKTSPFADVMWPWHSEGP